MKTWLPLCSLLLTIPAAVAAVPFEFVMHYDGQEISIECREGCRIPLMTPSRCLPGRCEAIVSDGAITVAGRTEGAGAGFRIMSDAQDDPAFQVILHPDEPDLVAECRFGCDWRQEVVRCTTGACTATIDELGVRMGDVAETDRATAHRRLAAEQHPGHEWVRCQAEHLARVRMEGGPATFGAARGEARAACVEHRAAWRSMAEQSDAEALEAERLLDDLLRQVWEQDLDRAFTPAGAPGRR